MKKIVLLLALGLACVAASAQMKYTEASDLTLVGKLFQDTPNPYHRIDTVRFKGFTAAENKQVREPSGISVAFKTSSSKITVTPQYGFLSFPNNTNGFSARGFDLYIRKDGEWCWAASCCPAESGEVNGKEITLIKDMAAGVKECLLYLPLYSELNSVKIGTESDAEIEAIANPFLYRVGVFGSSFTHGSSTSRPGMAWPAQFSRATGIQMLSIGCSGNSKLQSYFAAALAKADVDAYVFDAFSNPSIEEIQARLFPFIEKIRSEKPETPMIFLKTAFREGRNFNTKVEDFEARRMAVVDSLMNIACKRYNNVFWVDATETRSKFYAATVDGTHPDNFGYYLWEKSIEKPVAKLIRKKVKTN